MLNPIPIGYTQTISYYNGTIIICNFTILCPPTYFKTCMLQIMFTGVLFLTNQFQCHFSLFSIIFNDVEIDRSIGHLYLNKLMTVNISFATMIFHKYFKSLIYLG